MPAMHARAALYTLMLANGLKQLLDTGALALLCFVVFTCHLTVDTAHHSGCEGSPPGSCNTGLYLCG